MISADIHQRPFVLLEPRHSPAEANRLVLEQVVRQKPCYADVKGDTRDLAQEEHALPSESYWSSSVPYAEAACDVP